MSVAAAVLAAAEPGKAGPLALLIVGLLAVATVLLYRSMTKQLRKVPRTFDPPPEDRTADPPSRPS